MGEAERRKAERIEELAAKEQADKRSADLRSVIEGRVNKVLPSYCVAVVLQ